jgi:hypothetical protein
MSMPMTVALTEIQVQKDSAQANYELALEQVCKLAQNHPEGLAAVATLNGFAREVQALRKIELNLISTGKPA